VGRGASEHLDLESTAPLERSLMPTLTPGQRARLKARAHALEPVVHIGQAGISETVVAEVDRSLTAHGLIKVRLAGADRDTRANSRRRSVIGRMPRSCSRSGVSSSSGGRDLTMSHRSLAAFRLASLRPARKPARLCAPAWTPRA